MYNPRILIEAIRKVTNTRSQTVAGILQASRRHGFGKGYLPIAWHGRVHGNPAVYCRGFGSDVEQRCGDKAQGHAKAWFWAKPWAGDQSPLAWVLDRAGCYSPKHQRNVLAMVRREAAAATGDYVHVLGGPLSGLAPRVAGHRAMSSRWRSTNSTIRVLVGADWIADRLPVWEDKSGDQRQIVTDHGAVTMHGYTARHAWSHTRNAQVLVTGPDGYGFHVPAHTDFRVAIRWAITAQRQRRDAEQRQRAVDGADLTRIWVTFEDSLRVGHCYSGTEKALEDIELTLGAAGRIGAIRADCLYALRGKDDPYARRAVTAAVIRTLRV